MASRYFFFRIFGYDHFFFFQMSEVFLRFGDDDARQADEGDEVRDSHEAVDDISQDPDDVEFDERAAGDEGDEDDAVRHDAFDADEGFDAP